MNKKISEILKPQAPPKFDEFFKNRASRQQATIDLLIETMPTSGSPQDLLEESTRSQFLHFLKNNQPLFSQLLVQNRKTMAVPRLQESLEESLEGGMSLDEFAMAISQALLYTGISFEDYINFKT